MRTITNPIKWHGGKYYLADRIVALMPKHTHYVEPFAGGLSVLLAKPFDGVSEVVNDLNSELTNFWDVIKFDHTFREMLRILEATPFSEKEWSRAHDVRDTEGAVRRAVAFFVRCRQSMSGRMVGFAPLSRNRVRRGMNEQASAWITAIEGLPEVHNRLKRVVVLNRPAIDVIRSQAGPQTLFYLDPPYVHETRATTTEYGEQEMTVEEHSKLVRVVKESEGKFLISMYKHEIYDDLLQTKTWKVRDFDLPNNSAGGSVKRRMTERVYMNC